MSLDVSLISKYRVRRPGGSRIYVREDGRTVQIGEDEWYKRYPHREPVRLHDPIPTMTNEVFDWNITHNLIEMACRANLYMALWRPEEGGFKQAEDLIPVLEDGLDRLKSNREYYEQFNPENGWGKYENLVEFVDNYLAACRKYPTARIEMSR